VKRELTEQELADFRRIMRPREPVELDDTDSWDRKRDDAEEMHRTGDDPYVRRLREMAAGATGGESCNPGRSEEPTEEGR
jgi:hypothetical protein